MGDKIVHVGVTFVEKDGFYHGQLRLWDGRVYRVSGTDLETVLRRTLEGQKRPKDKWITDEDDLI